MKYLIKITCIFIIITSCSGNYQKKTKLPVQANYGLIISNYLTSKVYKPTLVFNNRKIPSEKTSITLSENEIKWMVNNKGDLEIRVNSNLINTALQLPLNNSDVSNSSKTLVVNYVNQIKYYEEASLIGFILSFQPCVGLGCSFNFQLIYDLATNKVSFFDGFKTGFESELYDFNQDTKLDFLSRAYSNGFEERFDTIEYVLFSQTENGNFRQYCDGKHNKYSFSHIYHQIPSEKDRGSYEEYFIENWIEKINDAIR